MVRGTRAFQTQLFQAQKLQRLLWLAQGHYAATYHGRKLMPATFVAMTIGPREPNIYRAYELGRPALPDMLPPEEVIGFFDRLWGRFGHHSAEHLDKLVRAQRVYTEALKKGEGEEIPFENISRYYTEQSNVKPQTVVRSADGREWKKLDAAHR